MSTANELACQAEIKHLKALIHFKDTHILTLEETIRRLKRKERQQREKKRDAESNIPETPYIYEDWAENKWLGGTKIPEKTLVYENKVCKLERLCAHCERYVKTL